ncbi:ATP-binding cassette domain-containing protein, partial [bacterium]|nr:ATP-binding cassette domain-containing protein [bacterium]
MSGEEKKQRVHLRPLLAHGARHWKAYLLGVISLAAVDFINSLLLPCLIGIPFEQADKEHAGRALFAPFFRDLLGVGTNSTARVFLECGLLYVAINIVQMGLRYFWRYFFMGGAERIGFEVRAALFRKLQRLPVSWFDRAKTGDLMSRATSDIDYVKSAYGFGALMAFDSLCYLAMVPFSLFWISPKLAGLLCCALPLVTVLIYKLGGIVHRRSRVVQDVSGKLSARLQESFSGIRVVQSFAQEEREAERFEAVAREYVESQLSLARIQAVWGPSFEAIFEVAGAIILIVGGLDVVKGLLEPADFVRFIRGMDNLIWPMAAVGMLANSLQRGAAAHARLEEIHSETEDPAFLSDRVPAEAEVRGAVSVRSLTFSFPGATGKPLALEDVSFEAPAGALVAVVGPVGSGKSALLWLLARLYEPPAGKIFLDGRDILSIPIATLRRAVAIVPQETFLF